MVYGSSSVRIEVLDWAIGSFEYFIDLHTKWHLAEGLELAVCSREDDQKVCGSIEGAEQPVNQLWKQDWRWWVWRGGSVRDPPRKFACQWLGSSLIPDSLVGGSDDGFSLLSPTVEGRNIFFFFFFKENKITWGWGWGFGTESSPQSYRHFEIIHWSA